MSRKNANNLRIFYLLIFSVLLGSVCWTAEPVLTAFSAPFLSVQSYQSFVYGLTQSELMRFSASGQSSWRVPKSLQPSTNLVVAYNHLFLVNDRGMMQCLNLDYGDIKWKKFTGTLRSFGVSSPVLVAHTSKGHLMGLGYLSGQLLWQTSQTYSSWTLLGAIDRVMAVSDRHLIEINLFTGRVESTVLLPDVPTQLYALTGQKMAIQFGQSWKIYSAINEAQSWNIPERYPGQWALHRYWVYIQPHTKKWGVFEAGAITPIWEKELPSDFDYFLASRDQLLTISRSRVAREIQISSGKIGLDSVTLPVTSAPLSAWENLPDGMLLYNQRDMVWIAQ